MDKIGSRSSFDSDQPNFEDVRNKSLPETGKIIQQEKILTGSTTSELSAVVTQVNRAKIPSSPQWLKEKFQSSAAFLKEVFIDLFSKKEKDSQKLFRWITAFKRYRFENQWESRFAYKSHEREVITTAFSKEIQKGNHLKKDFKELLKSTKIREKDLDQEEKDTLEVLFLLYRNPPVGQEEILKTAFMENLFALVHHNYEKILNGVEFSNICKDAFKTFKEGREGEAEFSGNELSKNIGKSLNDLLFVKENVKGENSAFLSFVDSEINSIVVMKKLDVENLVKSFRDYAIDSRWNVDYPYKVNEENLIRRAYLKEQEKKGDFEKEFLGILQQAGIGEQDLPDSDLKRLKVLFLLSRNPVKGKGEFLKQVFHNILFQGSYKVFSTGIKTNIEKEQTHSNELKKFLGKENLSKEVIKQISGGVKSENNKIELERLIIIMSRFKDKKTEFGQFLEEEINSCLTKEVLKAFDDIWEKIVRPGTKQEQVKAGLKVAMESLHYLSKKLPYNSKNEDVWEKINKKFDQIVGYKGKDNFFEEYISELFKDFNSFIEDGVFAYIYSEGGSAEDVFQKLFDRTAEEVEKIKTENRKNVVKQISTLAQVVKENSEKITIDTLKALHETNNKNIVPSSFADVRSGENLVGFADQIGLIGKDTEEAVQNLLNRVNQMVEEDRTRPYSKLRWGIEVAKFHNELLQIHPFFDRNGSTSLLFVELLMSLKGYKPSQERSSDYYPHLKKIFRNPLAVVIVAYEHFKITHVPGYYKGKGIKLDRAKKALYEGLLEKHLSEEAEEKRKA